MRCAAQCCVALACHVALLRRCVAVLLPRVIAVVAVVAVAAVAVVSPRVFLIPEK